VTFEGSAVAVSRPAVGVAPRPLCERCGSLLRSTHRIDPRAAHVLCDPCERLVASCAPFVRPLAPRLEQAPANVNLLELVAGIVFTHDALHPGEKIDIKEALARHGVAADNVLIWQIVGKLKRRHGIVLAGESRQTGYRMEDWTWEARRVRSSVAGR
jgi:hypothetical protein